MRRISILWLTVLLHGCVHLGLGGSERQRVRLWDEAHQALARGEYAQAIATFGQLAGEYPDSREGVESLFYLGAIPLDPRNPGWNPEPAEANLRRYLAVDSADAARITRRPEAEVLFQLARQLNLPPDQRIPDLQPTTRVVEVPQVISRYRDNQEIRAEVDRLRKELVARETTIRQLREELERIRKTLTERRQ